MYVKGLFLGLNVNICKEFRTVPDKYAEFSKQQNYEIARGAIVEF